VSQAKGSVHLEQHLRSLGITSLAFAGCNFPNCPRTSIYEASERDFRIVLVEDAISGLYDRGREEMKNIGVVAMTTNLLAQNVARCKLRAKGEKIRTTLGRFPNAR
jgi:nicotinamidase-related amidase